MSATTPNSPPPPPRWWIANNGATEGPFGEGYIAACASQGAIHRSDLALLGGIQPMVADYQLATIHGFCRPAVAEAEFVPPVLISPAVAVDTEKYATGGLPGNIQWACTYGRYVSPAIYVLYFFDCILTSAALPNGFQGHMTDLFVQFLLRLMMFFGAGMLPRQHRNGAGRTRTSGLLLVGWYVFWILFQLNQPEPPGMDGEDLPPELALAIAATCLMLPIVLGEIAYLIYMAIVLNDFQKNYWRSGQ